MQRVQRKYFADPLGVTFFKQIKGVSTMSFRWCLASQIFTPQNNNAYTVIKHASFLNKVTINIQRSKFALQKA